MTLSRWKLVAGVVGLAVCGVAALAEPACRTFGITHKADDTKPAESPKPLPLPDINPPASTEVPPVIPPVTDAKPLPTPVSPPPVALPVVPDAKPTPTAPVPVLLPTTEPTFDPKKDPLFEIDVKGTKTILPTPVPTPKPEVTKPAPVNVDVEPLPLPKPGNTSAPKSPTPVFVPDVVVPVKDEKAVPPTGVVTPVPNVIPNPQVIDKANPFAGKKLKVTLHLSDEKPQFEVRDGEEVVLKVTADGVQFVATNEKVKADAPSNLVAVGAVKFRTLGGEGACDELKVMLSSGEVVVTGKVSVTSNWGRTETTATAEKMTFRLGGEGKK